ncbi:MAG: MerR family transcriptional regulator [Tahibacter sp.]
MSNSTPPPTFLRIGAIAKRLGLSAKALRLYHERGLLKPCRSSEAGYRLYGPAALQRLNQIVLLKRGGFSLAQIGELLDRDARPAARLLAERIAMLERDLQQQTLLLAALRRAAQRVDSASNLNVDELLENIAMSQHLDVDLTPEQRIAFRQRAEQLGNAGLEEAQRIWPELIAQVRAAMQAGMPAADPAVVELGQRWYALVQAATGNDPAINRKLSDAYLQQPQAMAMWGMDVEMFRYIGQAMAQAGLSLHGE